MIDFFIKTGGQDVSHFSDYIWREKGFKTILEKHETDDVSSELKLFLIKYIVDGEIVSFKESKRKVSTYDASEKEISVDIHVRKDDFWTKNEIERKRFIVTTTLNAVDLAEKKIRQKKINIGFEDIKMQIAEAAKEYFILK